jgi:hypothetical protein
VGQKFLKQMGRLCYRVHKQRAEKSVSEDVFEIRKSSRTKEEILFRGQALACTRRGPICKEAEDQSAQEESAGTYL